MKRRRPTTPTLNALKYLRGKEVINVLETEKGLALLTADALRTLVEVPPGAGRHQLEYVLLTRIGALTTKPLPHPKGLMVDLFMPPDRAEDALYNILGRYDYWLDTHGRSMARLIFFTQSAGAILSFWTDWLMGRLKLLRFLRNRGAGFTTID